MDLTDFVSIKLRVAWKRASKEQFLEGYVAKSVDVVATGHTVGSMSSKMRRSGIKPIKGSEISRHFSRRKCPRAGA